MTEPTNSSQHAEAGRFVVELPGERRSGLAAHEVALLLETPEAAEAVIYRIHRVGEAGRMELVGVLPAAFKREDHRLFARSDVREARADYDALVQHAANWPPPCRVRLRLVRDSSAELSSMVAVSYPAVCADAVAAWIKGCPQTLGAEAPAAAEPAAIDPFHVQIVLEETVEPR